MARTLNAGPEPPKVFVPVPREPEGWTIKPHGDGFGLFRSGRDRPVAVGKTHAELADRIAGPRSKAPAIAKPDWEAIQLSAAMQQANIAEREHLNAEAVRLEQANIAEQERLNAAAVRLDTLKAEMKQTLRERFPLSDYGADVKAVTLSAAEKPVRSDEQIYWEYRAMIERAMN